MESSKPGFFHADIVVNEEKHVAYGSTQDQIIVYALKKLGEKKPNDLIIYKINDLNKSLQIYPKKSLLISAGFSGFSMFSIVEDIKLSHCFDYQFETERTLRNLPPLEIRSIEIFEIDEDSTALTELVIIFSMQQFGYL